MECRVGGSVQIDPETTSSRSRNSNDTDTVTMTEAIDGNAHGSGLKITVLNGTEGLL